MRLLVTGASGFIGRNLLLRVPRNWDVVATFHRSRDFERFVVENALENVQVVNVDLADVVDTKQKLRGEFDCAVHLAANTDLSLCVRNPHEDLRLNVGTLLNTVKTAKIRHLIFMSSGAVYDGRSGLVSPDVRVDPSFPYAIAKLACERYVSFFKKNRLIDSFVILRFFGAYGPYEPSRKIFTKFVKAFHFEKSRDFTLVGDGNNFIDAMFVVDAVEGLLSMVGSNVRDVTVDFASGEPLRINELLSRVAKIFGLDDVTVRHKGWPVEYITFHVSGKSMESLLGFKPKTSLEVGIWKLAEWLEKGRA